MSAGEYGVVTTTVALHEDANRITDILLSERLAACVQVLPINSRYVWKGERTQEPELMMLIKTRVDLFDQVTARLLEEHPYELAEITATPFAAGSPAYLGWIGENTGPENTPEAKTD